MKRRELLVASGAAFAGCVGTGDGDSTPTQPRLGQVTLDNRDTTAHEFAVTTDPATRPRPARQAEPSNSTV